MVLRLGSSNSHTTSLQLLVNYECDVNVSTPVKAEVLKFLGVITQNLLVHSDEKYRQLKLTNAKIQRMTAHTTVLTFLKDVLCFESITENGEALLRIPGPLLPSVSILETVQKDITDVRSRIERTLPSTTSEATKVPSNHPPAPLTERQKVRQRAMDAAEQEKVAVTNARKRTVALIHADQHVRANDANWKPSVSAAAAKSGDAMTTFRDKFGEND